MASLDPKENPVQRVPGTFAFQGGCKLCLFLLEAPQDGIGELTINFDVAFPGKGVGVRGLRWAGVAEQAVKEVGEKVGQQGGFVQFIRAAGGNEPGPVLEFGLPGGRLLWQVEGWHLLTQDFRVKSGLDSTVICRAIGCATPREKPSPQESEQPPSLRPR